MQTAPPSWRAATKRAPPSRSALVTVEVAAAEQAEDDLDPVRGERPPDRLGDHHAAVSGRLAGT